MSQNLSRLETLTGTTRFGTSDHPGRELAERVHPDRQTVRFSPSVAASLLEQVVEGMARLGDHLASCRVPDEEAEALLSHVAVYRERLAGRGMSPDPGMSPGV